MNIKYILYIIIFIQILLLYNNKNKQETENFTENLNDVKNDVKEVYKNDLEDIKYIFKLSEDIGKIKKPYTFNYNLNVTGYLNLFPKGSIVIYNDITPPEGWVICDGQNETPDLRGRFVRMWNDNEKNFNQTNNNETNFRGLSKLDSSCKLLKHNINTVGGTDLYKITDTKFIPKHNHTVSTIPAHNHDFFIQLYNGSFNDDGGSGKPYVRGGAGRNQTDYISFTKEKNHTHTVSSVGSSEPKYITNQPPYFTLTYIMKT
jgi:microcystin-dependent protein